MCKYIICVNKCVLVCMCKYMGVCICVSICVFVRVCKYMYVYEGACECECLCV